MTIQASFFTSGGVVAHRLRLNSNVSKLRFSVWWDAEGKMTDAEGFDALNRSRPVSDKLKAKLAPSYGLACAIARRGNATA